MSLISDWGGFGGKHENAWLRVKSLKGMLVPKGFYLLIKYKYLIDLVWLTNF